MLERELKSLPFQLFLADRLASDHNHVFKNLFGEVPMFGCGAAADVGRREQRGYKNPGIIQNAV